MINKTPAELQVEYEDEMEQLLDDTDPCSIFDAISMIADHGDIDLIEFLEKLLQGYQWKFGLESVIQDILESSQSNLDNSLLNLRRAAILDNK
jgi:hypothetical protein